MEFDIPSDLIRQVQTLIREEAGLSCYDPLDPTLPAVPSLRESIAGFDPSPAYLRCKHCKGRLLRGLQSVICVYCGKFQPKDVPPDPISFKSTFGYKWLLQSLDLDGSETVSSAIEENELSKRQTTKKDGIPLSDLLDLKISWPDALDKADISLAENESLQNKSFLNLSGVDFDNFFSELKETNTHAFQKQEVDKHVENIESNAQENLNLFHNVQPSESAVSSSQFQNDDYFSGWEADFQSANSGNQHVTSTSSEPFVSSSVDLSVHMESVFGSGKELADGKSKISSSESPSDWMQGDLWNNTKHVSIHEGERVDAAIQIEDGKVADDLFNPASTSVDWFTDDQWQAGSRKVPENKTSNEDDDSFDMWDDFASSTSAQHLQSGNQIPAVVEQKKEISSSTAINTQEIYIGSFTQQDDDSFDKWDDFASSTSAQRQQSGNQTPAVVEEKKEINSSTANNTREIDFGSVTQQDDDSFDMSGGFASSTSAQLQQIGNQTPAVVEQKKEINSSTANNTEEIDFGCVTQQDDDSLDMWDGFASSTSAQHQQSGNQIAAIVEQKKEINSSTAKNTEEIDFGSFTQQPLSSESLSSQNASAEVNVPEIPASDRTTHVDFGAQQNDQQEAKGGDILNLSQHGKGDVEILMSQMHDLSFMLKDDLSVPPK